MASVIRLLPAIFASAISSTADAFSNGCDLPSPDHPDPIQSIELEEGMIYRYPYSSFTAVADAPGSSGGGHQVSFKANRAGSFKIRIYRDLEGRSLASDSETVLTPNDRGEYDTVRSFFCGTFTGPTTERGLVEIEVVSGSLTLNDLFVIEAYDGVLRYSDYNPSLLSVAAEPVVSEIRDRKLLVSIARSQLGHSYCIEKSSDLKDWDIEPNTEATSNGGSLAWRLDSKAEGSLFYRIKETD
jgi:hypothetical protein